MSEVDVIYKICSKDEWKTAQSLGYYGGSRDDKRDGFIHLSASDQISRTLDKHFKGQIDLLLLEIITGRLEQKKLKWELSNKGDKFPHLYGDLNLDAVINVSDISNDK